LRQPVDLIFGPVVFNRHVLALDIACLLETLAKNAQTVRKCVRRCSAEEPNHRHRWLLCVCAERPSRSRTGEQSDELASLHSMTSSARASTVGGMSRPRALAVLRLITSSYLVGACTGRSAGFSPLRTRST